MPTRVKNLVVDTSAFIKSTPLQELGDKILTVCEVVEEVKCKRQLRRLAAIPFDVKVNEVDPVCLSFVTNFSKKTGDYLYLSATDLKLIALTYQLEKQLVGSDHLRDDPVCNKSIEVTEGSNEFKTTTPGFYIPEKAQTKILPDIDAEEENHLQEVPDVDTEVISKQFSQLSCAGFQQNDKINDQVDSVTDFEKEELDEEEGDEDELASYDDEHDSEHEGWITPSNLFKKNSTLLNGFTDENIETPVVACLTTDFSIQNVLKQIGLNVLSLDGMLIKELRKFVLRCYGCFHVTPQTTRLFCPKCGNKTLKRVSVVVDAEGNEHIKINFRRPISAKGKKFPLPRPRGGKHAVNPILCEDQRVPQQRLSKLALTKNNPMNPDYVAGVSPFVMRDVCSRSAVLNVALRGDLKYWMRKNPNEVIKRRRKK